MVKKKKKQTKKTGNVLLWFLKIKAKLNIYIFIYYIYI